MSGVAFTGKALEVLQHVSRVCEPITKRDLEKLKVQLESALQLDDMALVPMTEQEKESHYRQYGASILVGDFVIKRR